MKITVMGSASGLAVPNRNSSAYLVASDSGAVLMDAGDGVVQQLVRCGVNSGFLDSVVISHTHPDHAAGLFSLLQWMQLTDRKKVLKIFLPKKTLPCFQSILPCFHIFPEDWPFPFSLVAFSDGTVIKKNRFQISAIGNGHIRGKEESFSFYLQDEDSGVIYTSDIDSLAHLSQKRLKADLLISECTHVGPADILEYARSAGIGRVILTHIPPGLDNPHPDLLNQMKSLNVSFTFDGETIEV